MVEKIKSEGISPSVLVTPEVRVALREFFTKDSRERMAFLHGEIDEKRLVLTVKDITIPPQISAASTVDLDTDSDPEAYFEYHDELMAKHKVVPVIGQAHSFTGGAHHSPRDDGNDVLLASIGQREGGRTMFLSITTSSLKAKDDFRCDVVVTPPGMSHYNIVHEDVEWRFLADSKEVTRMLEGSEERVKYAVVKKQEASPTGSASKK